MDACITWKEVHTDPAKKAKPIFEFSMTNVEIMKSALRPVVQFVVDLVRKKMERGGYLEGDEDTLKAFQEVLELMKPGAEYERVWHDMNDGLSNELAVRDKISFVHWMSRIAEVLLMKVAVVKNLRPAPSPVPEFTKSDIEGYSYGMYILLETLITHKHEHESGIEVVFKICEEDVASQKIIDEFDLGKLTLRDLLPFVFLKVSAMAVRKYWDEIYEGTIRRIFPSGFPLDAQFTAAQFLMLNPHPDILRPIGGGESSTTTTTSSSPPEKKPRTTGLSFCKKCERMKLTARQRPHSELTV